MLNFAIIGCGHIAKRHAMHIASIGNLVAVCDTVVEKAEALAQSYPARIYSNADDLFNQEKALDVVAVCTPNYLHAPHTIAALRAGYHVICEKPMAIKTADCRDMIEEAEKTGRKLFVVKQNRFNPPVMAIKELQEEDKLGRIYSIHVNGIWNRNKEYYANSWKGNKDMDGGILYTQFSHFIDLLYWIAGDIKQVHAYTTNVAHNNIIEFEDTVVGCTRFANGALGSVHFSINSHQENMEGSLLLVAEKGTVKIGGKYLDRLEYQHIENHTIRDLSAGNVANDYGGYTGSMSNHDKVYQHVLDVISNNTPNLFDGQDALKTVEIIEKIYAAADGPAF